MSKNFITNFEHIHSNIQHINMNLLFKTLTRCILGTPLKYRLTVRTALALSSLKSRPSLIFPRHTANNNAPLNEVEPKREYKGY